MPTLTGRMGEDMRLRGFAPKTQPAYRGAVAGLAQHFTRSPDTLDTLTEAELRAFFLELVTTRQVSRSTLIVYRSGIRFLYEVTLQRTWPVLISCDQRSAMCCRSCCRPTKSARCWRPCRMRGPAWRSS